MEETKRAAAALCVGVGHFSDPEELPGLSHYLEHMLFMGSEKFPDENEYDTYLNQHNGSSNAFTEEETTTFHFECAPPAFLGALDRFAQFFVSPLLKPDALEREVLAVDSEFSGVLQSDQCRLAEARAIALPSDHPASKFGWGNAKSLRDIPTANEINVRDHLIKYYKSHYSAERMNLVVISGEDMADMESWIDSLFSEVSSGAGPCPRFDHYHLPDNHIKFNMLPSAKEEHKLALSFRLPSSLEKEYEKKAEDYVSHLVGHEGSGSLLAKLKHLEWASDLCAGIIDQTSAFWLFEISITLTEAGLHAGSGNGLEVARAVFSYLDMLRSSRPQKWIWDEMKAISKIKWDYLEEEDPSEYVSQIASDMNFVPLHHVLEWSHIHDHFDPDLIQYVLDLLTPDSCQVHLQTHKYEEQVKCMQASECISGMQTVTDKWFNFDFISGTLDNGCISPRSDLFKFHLPKANPYIASNFSLAVDEEMYDSASAGQVLYPGRLQIQGSSVFHLLDDRFRVPRLSCFFRYMYNVAESSPRNVALTHMVIKILEDILCEEAYLADMAGLHYSIYMEGHNSIDFRIEGFSDKIDQLTLLIFSKFAQLEFKDEDFDRILETVHRHYYNALIKPTKHAAFLRLQTLKHHHTDPRDVLEELKTITSNEVRRFSQTLTQKGHLTSLIEGNCTSTTACNMFERAKSCIGLIDTKEEPLFEILKLREDILRREVTVNPEEKNSCIEYYIQLGSVLNVKERALLDLVDQILYEPCYNVLRTQQQLGYHVSSGTRLTHGVQGFCITIQSSTYAASELESKIDAFLINFTTALESMTPEEFSKNKESVIDYKKSKPTTLAEQGDRHWDSLVHRAGHFDFRHHDITAIESISHGEILDYFATHIAPGKRAAKRIIIHVDPPTKHDGAPPNHPLKTLLTKDQLAAFHAEQDSFPPLPTI